jgi:hypothetical protein
MTTALQHLANCPSGDTTPWTYIATLRAGCWRERLPGTNLSAAWLFCDPQGLSGHRLLNCVSGWSRPSIDQNG